MVEEVKETEDKLNFLEDKIIELLLKCGVPDRETARQYLKKIVEITDQLTWSYFRIIDKAFKDIAMKLDITKEEWKYYDILDDYFKMPDAKRNLNDLIKTIISADKNLKRIFKEIEKNYNVELEDKDLDNIIRLAMIGSTQRERTREPITEIDMSLRTYILLRLYHYGIAVSDLIEKYIHKTDPTSIFLSEGFEDIRNELIDEVAELDLRLPRRIGALVITTFTNLADLLYEFYGETVKSKEIENKIRELVENTYKYVKNEISEDELKRYIKDIENFIKDTEKEIENTEKYYDENIMRNPKEFFTTHFEKDYYETFEDARETILSQALKTDIYPVYMFTERLINTEFWPIFRLSLVKIKNFIDEYYSISKELEELPKKDKKRSALLKRKKELLTTLRRIGTNFDGVLRRCFTSLKTLIDNEKFKEDMRADIEYLTDIIKKESGSGQFIPHSMYLSECNFLYNTDEGIKFRMAVNWLAKNILNTAKEPDLDYDEIYYRFNEHRVIPPSRYERFIIERYGEESEPFYIWRGKKDFWNAREVTLPEIHKRIELWEEFWKRIKKGSREELTRKPAITPEEMLGE